MTAILCSRLVAPRACVVVLFVLLLACTGTSLLYGYTCVFSSLPHLPQFTTSKIRHVLTELGMCLVYSYNCDKVFLLLRRSYSPLSRKSVADFLRHDTVMAQNLSD
jgi:hypothetical protein